MIGSRLKTWLVNKYVCETTINLMVEEFIITAFNSVDHLQIIQRTIEYSRLTGGVAIMENIQG